MGRDAALPEPKENMSKAGDDQAAERLARKLTTEPFDPLAVPESKPSSYEKFIELSEDIRQSGDEEIAKWRERESILWDSVGKKDEQA